jgi:DNA-binding NarL/FixJ family response regulator
MPITILLADDHAIFRESLRILLERRQEYQIVGEAANGRQAVELADRLQPTIIVLDLAMPGLGGLEALRDIRSRHPQALIIVLSAHEEEATVADAFRLGANAFVAKEQSIADLVEAVRAVLAGERYLSSQLARMADGARSDNDARPPAAGEFPYALLTWREQQVLSLSAQGFTNAEIGERLTISARTVETHRAHLMLKLGLKSRLDLTRSAHERQLR